MRFASEFAVETADLDERNTEFQRLLGPALPRGITDLGHQAKPARPSLSPVCEVWDKVFSHCAALAETSANFAPYVDGLAAGPEQLKVYLIEERNELAIAAVICLANVVKDLKEWERTLWCLSAWAVGRPAADIASSWMLLWRRKVPDLEHSAALLASLERLSRGIFRKPFSPGLEQARKRELTEALRDRAEAHGWSEREELRRTVQGSLVETLHELKPGLSPAEQIQAIWRSLEKSVVSDLLGPDWRVKVRDRREISLDELLAADEGDEVPRSPDLQNAWDAFHALQAQEPDWVQQLEEECELRNFTRMAKCAGVTEADLDLLLALGDRHGGLAEEAATQGITSGAAKMRASRAKAKLKDILSVYRSEQRGERADHSHRQPTDERPLAPVALRLIEFS